MISLTVRKDTKNPQAVFYAALEAISNRIEEYLKKEAKN